MILTAEDLEHANMDCLGHRLCTVFNHEDRPPTTYPTTGCSCASNSNALLAVLNGNPKERMTARDISALNDFHGAEIWCYAQFPEPPHVGVGDYGYIHPHTGRFTRLGNMFELLQSGKSPKWTTSVFVDDMPGRDVPGWVWGQTAWRFPVNPPAGKEQRTAVVQWMSAADMSVFFWRHACQIAERHGISPRSLILVQQRTNMWKVSVLRSDAEDSGASSPSSLPFEGSNEIYFHQRPLLECGAVPLPFGYWSLESEPRPGPWPEVSLPGYQLDCGMQIVYAYLNSFQTELIACFDQILRLRIDETSCGNYHHVGCANKSGGDGGSR